MARTQYRYLKKSEGYISNIISALVTGDWASVVSQCTTDSWKEALVAILTHCGDHVPLLCERLAERLQIDGENNSTVIQSAILCYLCAGNVERLAEVWLTTYTQNASAVPTTEELQDLIEVVILFQKALELQGRSVNASGKLANLLTQYATLLVTQGALSSALTYLGPSDDPNIADLRERLYYALGHKQLYVARSQSQTQNLYAKSQTPNKFNQQRSSLSAIQQPSMPFNSNFGNSMPPAPIAPTVAPTPMWNTNATTHLPQQPQWGSTPYVPPVSAPLNPLLSPTQTKPPVGKPPQLADPISHPPRPPSVSGSSSTTRSKYVLDPSVQSSSAYGSTWAPPPLQPNTLINSQPIGNNYNSNQFQQFTPAPTNAFNSQPFNTNPIGAQPSVLNPPALNSFAPNVPPLEVAQPALQHQRNPTPPPGWNDPPALKSTRQVS